jgi:hypothetical protein
MLGRHFFGYQSPKRADPVVLFRARFGMRGFRLIWEPIRSPAELSAAG